MQGIRSIYEAFVRWIIRFFDSKSLRDDEVDYLRMELDKLKVENQELLNYILRPSVTKPEAEEDNSDWQPISKYKPWSSKQKELEEASRLRAIALAHEARVNLASKKTTEQLENELLTGTD